MKTCLITFLIVFIALMVYSCNNDSNGTLDYKTLHYDTNRIVIFIDSTKSDSTNNTDPLLLTKEDLRITDSFLKDAIDSFNVDWSPKLFEEVFKREVPLDSFIIKYDRYWYQYFPVKDVNGERVIDIVGFNRAYPLWKQKEFPRRSSPGMSELHLQVNLSKKERTNLRSGDFGG